MRPARGPLLLRVLQQHGLLAAEVPLMREALQNLESECDGRGDEVGHPLFVAFYLGQSRGAASSYEDLARRFDLDLHQVKNRLAALRVAFRRHVLGLMRDGLSTEEELVAELREVFGG